MADATAARTEALWIVLTPSIDEAGWRQAIAEGVARAGLNLRDAALEQPSSADNPGQDVWLTNDAEVIASLGRIPTAVIVPRPESAAAAVTTLQGLQPPHNVSQASMLLARAMAQDRRRTRMITADDIRRQRTAPFTLAEGLEIVAPVAQPFGGDEPAVVAALATFDAAPPAPGDTVEWPATLFRYDAPASRNAAAAGELDITGRPRILVYGPYFALTPGRWQARVRFLVDATAASKELRFDWGTPQDFQIASTLPPHSGVFEIDLTHDFKSVDYGEIRVWLMEGSFDGTLHFLGARLTYLGR